MGPFELAHTLVGSRRTPDGTINAAATRYWRSPVAWLVLCGAVLIAGIVIGAATMVIHFRERALNNTERELANTVQLLASHFDKQLEDFQVSAKATASDLRLSALADPNQIAQRLTSWETHLLLKAKIDGSADVAGLNLFDATGKLVNSSDSWPVVRSFSITDRAFYKAFQGGTATAPVQIELVKSRFSGTWATVFARAIIGPRGEFLGVTTRAIDPASFESFFESVALGQGSAISMFTRDGTMISRFPHVESMVGQNLNKGGLLQIAEQNGHGTTRLASPIDGLDRLGAARTLTQFPITIIATTTVKAALADWREQTRFLVFASGASAFVIAIMVFLIVRQVSLQHRTSRRRLAREKQRLDTAVDNMTQGLLMFDAEGRLIVCNQRYLDMFRLSRDQVKPGSTLRDLLTLRKQSGTFANDVDEYCEASRRRVEAGVPTQMTIDIGDGRVVQMVYKPIADGGWVTTLEDITERRQAEERIAHLAHYDALTDLPNRTLFRERLEHELAQLGDGRAQCAVLYIDIDEFKDINDSLGHPVGDELLRTLAARLNICVGDNGFVARLGGDEFAVVLTDVTSRDDVGRFVTTLHEAIRTPCDCFSFRITTDASIGIAVAPGDGADLDSLLKHADLAMYAAKADGRHTSRFFEASMVDKASRRRQMEQDMRQLIGGCGFADGGFEIHYQPLVSLKTGIVTGCEALLRWRHPERGMISPAEFIPVAEETGLINQLGEWVLSTACHEAANWPAGLKLAVNVSPVQFRSHTLALHVLTALSSSGLDANRLELEITEAVLMRDDDAALDILHQLRAIGVRIALDDFGTGYSSLSYLQRFPFDKIKIDRCFVKDIANTSGDESASSSSIVQAVVNIAAARNMTTTAEGVETESQRDLLRRLGCTEMQGWLFSAAKPAAEIRALLRAPRRKKSAA